MAAQSASLLIHAADPLLFALLCANNLNSHSLTHGLSSCLFFFAFFFFLPSLHAEDLLVKARGTYAACAKASVSRG